MNIKKIFSHGLLINFIFIFLSQLLINFHGYVYTRLGCNYDMILLILWIIPLAPAFLATYQGSLTGLYLCLIYTLIITLAFPFINFISGLLGSHIDFSGIKGLSALLKIYFYISLAINIIGATLGIAAKKIIH